MTTNGDGPLDRLQEHYHHPTHSIEWCWTDKRPATITCNKAQTVEELLKRSSVFRLTAEKLKKKELVIVRDGKAISSHFPCNLIKSERLTVKYVKAEDKSKTPAVLSPRSRVQVTSQGLVMFHLSVNGGKDVAKIMRNLALKTKVQEVTVYAYKGEKVRHALRRDGRFCRVIFQKTCALSNISTDVITELSNLVDGLEGKTFKIILLSKSCPPQSLDSVFEDDGESQQDADETHSQQLATTQPENGNVPEEQAQTKWATAPGTGLVVLPGLQRMRSNLSSQFCELVKARKTRVPKMSRIQNLFRVEYGQNNQMCKEVKTMKTLMERSDSVCLVRTKVKTLGSGFLLFGEFVLTNGHVVQSVYNQNEMRLIESVTVNFSYEGLDDMQEGQVDVEEVVGFEFQPGVPGCDWALLMLRATLPLPDGLFSESGFLPQSCGICIIGHPDGGVKKIDPCLIVKPENRRQVVKRHGHENPEHVQMITNRFFEDEQLLTYESCFYYGSSGSPVFDEHCRVVAMHSGGYAYSGPQGKTQSVIEFGHPLCTIIERIIIQTVVTGRFDVLKDCIVCSGVPHKAIKAFLENLTERCDLPEFKNAVNNIVTNGVKVEDDYLKGIFENIFQNAEAVPMDQDKENC